eukprot:4637592-Amphidinium_carterae.1
MGASMRKELAEAIADNIVMVAISKRVWDMQEGHLYRERLPKAIVDVSHEHGFDHKQLRVEFRLFVRGGILYTPCSAWEVAVPLGASLVDLLPPHGRLEAWMNRGVTAEMEEAAWQAFRQSYCDVCALSKARSVASTEHRLSRIEVKFAARMAVADE